MFVFCSHIELREGAEMLYPEATSLRGQTVNFVAAVAMGLFAALVGLNAASGCGQGGECIQVTDFTASPGEQVAAR